MLFFNQGMYAGVQLELEKAAADENTSITGRYPQIKSKIKSVL